MKKQPVTLEQVAGTLNELAEAMHMGFTSVQQELAKKADKEDLIDLGKSIRFDIADLREEVMGFTSDVRDDLSARITVLEKKRA